MTHRYRVIVRRNGRAYGEMTFASKSAAEQAAAQMQSAGTAGIEALLLGPARTENRRRRNPDAFPAIHAREPAVDYGTRYAAELTGYPSQSAAYAAGKVEGNAWHKAYFAGIDHHRAQQGAPKMVPHTPSLRRGEAHSSWEAELSGRDPLLHPSYYRSNPTGRFPRSTEVQTLLFDKSMFNVTRAKEWAKAHGYRTSGTDIGGDRATKIRLRQVDPEKFTKGTFRTIEFEPGIEAVIAMPKKAPVTRRNPADGSKRPTRASQVDAYLAAHGFPGVKLHRSARDAYCHFYGGEADDWSEAGVYVFRISDLTLDQWLREARMLRASHR